MSKAKIIYVYDALCGWCFGISPVMSKLFENYKDQIDFETLSGGMVTGERVGPISNMSAYIKKAYKTVEEYAGVKFGEKYLNGILEDGTSLHDSTIPGIAMTVFKKYQPENSILFAKCIQESLYHEGLEPAKYETYKSCFEKFGIDAEEAIQKMQDPQIKEETEYEFAQVKSWGIQGFPTVILQKNDKYYLIARGFTDYEALKETLENEIKS